MTMDDPNESESAKESMYLYKDASPPTKVSMSTFAT